MACDSAIRQGRRLGEQSEVRRSTRTCETRALGRRRRRSVRRWASSPRRFGLSRRRPWVRVPSLRHQSRRGRPTPLPEQRLGRGQVARTTAARVARPLPARQASAGPPSDRRHQWPGSGPPTRSARRTDPRI